jgi:NAD(P)-dependent dehydrogenase (short-subunit alcohol dehydrogenase family)
MSDLSTHRGLSRLEGRVALVVGGGQTPGVTVGNGRATSVVFAREGARVIVADRTLEAAEETVKIIADEGGEAVAWEADVTDEDQIRAMIDGVVDRWGRIDILQNNVGVSLAGGDASITDITPEAFDRITDINLRGMVLTCKHAVPVMRAQGSGVITNISSLATEIDYRYIAYKTTKAGVNALTDMLAITNAEHGIRANAILPGLMNTPMSVENRIGVLGATREEVVAERDSHVPLRGKMGTGWDVAYAALFLASDEAQFITGVLLCVDGGQRLRAG